MFLKRITGFFLLILFVVQNNACFFEDKIIIADFEDSSIQISKYKGDQSIIETKYTNDIVHNGKQSLKIHAIVKSMEYAGALMIVSDTAGDWSGMNYLNMWIYGEKNNLVIKVVIEDAQLEQFSYEFVEDFAKWKRVKIPLTSFQSREDWQASTAKVNNVIDYPIKALHFFSTAVGEFNLYYDNIEITGGKRKSKTQKIIYENIKEQLVNSELRTYADNNKILLGAAVNQNLLNNSAYTTTIIKNFNIITPEHEFNWNIIHPGKERYDFTDGDKIVKFARNHRILVKGTALIASNDLPEWLIKGDFSKDELLAILENHITTVVRHYKGHVYSWDVVREAFEADQLKKNFWFEKIGPEYIEKAFLSAHTADPDARLILSDNGNEEINPKSTAIYQYLQKLFNKKIPVNGVGAEFHLDIHFPPDYFSIYNNIRRFNVVGFEFQKSEIDCRISGIVTDELLNKQADFYAKLMEISLALPRNNVFMIWGVSDVQSKDLSSNFNSVSAYIFDERYQPKPAYKAIKDVLITGPIKVDEEAVLNNLQIGRYVIPPFEAYLTKKEPVIDGKENLNEWEEGILYPFAFNQLNPYDQRPPEIKKNLEGSWKILYHKKVIYGLVRRTDDITITGNKDDWENDCVEIYLNFYNNFIQLRTLVGKNFNKSELKGKRSAVWSADGKTLEFFIELPLKDLSGQTIGFNIALSDNDNGVNRYYQLYPVYGFNDCWQGKNLAELKFIGDVLRVPVERHLVPPFRAIKADSAPKIDGKIDNKEWSKGIFYPMPYNQLNTTNKTVQNYNLNGDWKILYMNNLLYGLLLRTDDITVTNNNVEWENDTVEIYYKVNNIFEQLRIFVGRDFSPASSLTTYRKAAWSSDGKILEFVVELPVDSLEGKMIGFNLALSDNDQGPDNPRNCQLYPINGYNDCWEGKNLAELWFIK